MTPPARAATLWPWPASQPFICRASGALLDHLARFEHRVTVETWNGEAVLESDGRLLLKSVGFYRDYPGMTWETG